MRGYDNFGGSRCHGGALPAPPDRVEPAAAASAAALWRETDPAGTSRPVSLVLDVTEDRLIPDGVWGGDCWPVPGTAGRQPSLPALGAPLCCHRWGSLVRARPCLTDLRRWRKAGRADPLCGLAAGQLADWTGCDH